MDVVVVVATWVGGLALSLVGGYWWTRWLLRRVETADSDDAQSVLRGGTYIGLLERAAITGAVLLGQPGGVAVVVAIKGLGRFPQLRDHPGASERFVIGTLASAIWAAAVGFAGLAVLGLR